jgi:hypothetical protein
MHHRLGLLLERLFSDLKSHLGSSAVGLRNGYSGRDVRPVSDDVALSLKAATYVVDDFR